MTTVSIEDNLFEIISKIAKRENITEEELLKEMIEKRIEEEEMIIYKDGMDVKIAAEELGMSPEELIKELDEAKKSIDKGEGIELDVDKLEERYL